jgi:hypothetical protein
MRLVIELSRLNVGQGTGETFGAGVFDLETNRLITPGVNLVTTANLSAAHAEIVAIMVAQQVVRLFDLGGPGHPPYELVASTEPCAQSRRGCARDPGTTGRVPRGGRGCTPKLRRSGGEICNARQGD